MPKKPAGLTQLEMALEGMMEPGALRGSVYRGLNVQIAALADAGTLDRQLEAGTIAAARSLAGVIDRASGLGGRKTETYALPQLHRELRELIGVLAGRGPVGADLSWLEDDPRPADLPPAADAGLTPAG